MKKNKHGLRADLLFILVTARHRKRTNEDRHNVYKYGKKLDDIQIAQSRNLYRNWIKYLKGKRLYMDYRSNAMRIVEKEHHFFYNSTSGFDPSDMIFNCVTELQILEVAEYMDKWNNKHFSRIDRIPSYSMVYPEWKKIYEDWKGERDLKFMKSLLCRRLYHMDAPEVKHSTYIGRSELKKSIIDTFIDKIFGIKR